MPLLLKYMYMCCTIKRKNNIVYFVEPNIHTFLAIPFLKIGLFYNLYLFNNMVLKNTITLNVASYTQ